MSQIWERVQELKDQTLYTLSRQKAFDISDVRPDRIVFIPQDGNGTERWASREQIEEIVNQGRAGKEITRALVAETYKDDQNTSYIAAIARAVAH